MQPQDNREQIPVTGEDLVEQVKHLIHEGNVRHLRILHEGHTILEIPVNAGLIGIVLAPLLAAVAAVGAMLTNCTIEVIRTEPPTAS